MQEPEYIDSVEHAIGMLYLLRTDFPTHPDGCIYEVFIDGDLLMSSVSPLSERELSTQAIAAHGGEHPQRILVGGLGLGYTAAAALESPRASIVRVVDRMDFVIHWLEKGLLPLSEALTNDPRVELTQSDVYADLLGPATETWDLLLIDVDHAPKMPLDAASLPFYTVDGQKAVAKHVAPGGIVAVWSAFDDEDFAAVMAEVYPESWRSRVRWDSPSNDGGMLDLQNTLFFGRVPA